MAQSSYNTILKYKTTEGTYEKLIDIKDFPDLGGSPELLETTTLSNHAQTYIHGIQSMNAMEFTANYTKADYEKLYALRNKEMDFQLWFGEDEEGSDGKFGWSGELTVWATGHGVNEVREMTISIAPSTEIELVD